MAQKSNKNSKCKEHGTLTGGGGGGGKYSMVGEILTRIDYVSVQNFKIRKFNVLHIKFDC